MTRFFVKRLFRLIAFALFSLAVGRAEVEGMKPKNFMLSDYVFERPEEWLWVPTDSEKAGQKLVIPDGDGKEAATVLMLFYPGVGAEEAETTIQLWKQQFEPRTFFKTRGLKIDGAQLTYVSVGGTQRSSKTRNEKRPGYALYGAVIVAKSGKIAARVVGPESVVVRVTKDFQQMIETGLKSAKPNAAP